MLEQVFATPIFIHTFDGEMLEKIQSEIAKEMPNILGTDVTIPWGSGSATTYKPGRPPNDIDTWRMAEVSKAIFWSIDQYLLKLNYSGPGFRVWESWFNFNDYGGFQYDHCHAGFRISGVYYYQTNGEDGVLKFKNPNPHLAFGQWPADFLQPDIIVKPEVGKMVLFPSWLEHRVTPNITDQQRISLSFNLV